MMKMKYFDFSYPKYHHLFGPLGEECPHTGRARMFEDGTVNLLHGDEIEPVETEKNPPELFMDTARQLGAKVEEG